MLYKTRLELVERLGQVGARLARVADRDDLVQILGDIIRTDIPVDWVGLYLLDPTTRRLVPAGDSPPGPAAISGGPLNRVCRDRMPLLVAGAEAAAVFRTIAAPDAPPAASLLFLPMLDGEDCLGAMGLADARLDRFADLDVALLSFILRQAAAALRNLTDAEQREKRQQELAAIHRAVGESEARFKTARQQVEDLARAQRDLQLALDGAPDLGSAMRAALATVQTAARVDAGALYLIDEKNDLRLAAHQGISAEFAGRAMHYTVDSPNARLAFGDQPTYASVAVLQPEIGDPLRREGLRAVAINPVWREGFAIACLVAGSRHDEEIAPAARHALEALALQIGGFIAKRRAEDALNQSTEFLKKLIDNLPVAIFGKDAAGRFSVWNKASERFYGIPKETVLGKTDYDFFPKDQADFFVRKDRETFEKRDTVDIPEEPIDSLSRGRRTIHTIKVPIYDDQGRPETLLGISEDITERQAALAGLEFREKFKELLMNLSTQFINLSADEIDAGVNGALAAIGRFSEADRALLLLLDAPGAVLTMTNEWCAPGVASSAATATPLQVAEYPMFRDLLAELRVAHVPSVAEMIAATAPERTVLARRNARSGILAPVAHAGKALGFVAFERVREDKAWDDESVDLLRVVGEMFANALTRKRIETELRDAKRAAEAAARAKSDFLATMSHEIRTPLSGMVGMLNLLNETSLSDEQRNYVRMAVVSADSLISIVNDVLDFAKVEAGKLRLESRAANLESELFEVAGIFRAKAEQKGLTLLVMFDPRAPREVFCDRLRLRQVLTNLLDNAIKFTDQGRIVVQADCIRRRRDHADFRVSVTDTGIGIPVDQHAAIFEPFTQGDGSAARRHGGAGLGLSITKHLVEMMGGEIRVESAPDRGATFSITLPFALPKSAFTTVHGDAVLAALQHETAPTEASRRILLAEDNAINQFAAAALLEKLGCRPVCVEDGAQAVALATAERFDAIFMDVQMPGMDGYEAARQIRALPGPAGRTPIIALTANAMGGDREKCLAAGMNDYLSKPVMKNDLQRLLTRWAPIVAAAPATVAVDKSVFDMPVALERFNGDAPLLHDLIDLFLSQAPARTEKIAEAIAVQDFAQLQQIAHSLKGGSSYISATRVTDAALRLEGAAKAADLALARSVFAELRTEVERLRGAVAAAFPR